MSTTLRNNGCGEQSTNGVIYYKLTPGYSGATTNDITKNCGLVGTEIDSNFHFLRGYDIESVEYDDTLNLLVLNRVNGEKLTAPIAVGQLQDVEFSYDAVTGELVIVYPDGHEERVSVFTSNGMTEFATDSTILGNGEVANPLRLNPIETTGTYAPADIYMDLTEEGAELPDARKGYRIVTKEYSNAFGRLYSYDAVQMISDALEAEGNGWRVPTKEDFDELLNALECDEYKNHSASTTGWFGMAAGQALKSTIFWNENNSSISSNNTDGLDTIGMTIYPTGNDDDDGGAEEFGNIASLWTNTEYNHEFVYVKKFKYDSNAVYQDALGKTNKYNAIRLVKEYDLHNYNEIDYILGLSYPTVLVRIPESNYIKIWTQINFYDIDEGLDSIAINFDGADVEEAQTVYYVNEWDGTKWVKKQLQEGDSVVILQKDNTEYREWRLKHGELYDIFGSDFNDDLSDILQSITNLSSATESFSASVVNNLTEINETIENDFTYVNGRIDELSANTKTFENGLKDTDNVVSIKIDENDEGYLHADSDGLRTEGINEAIENAINNAISNIDSEIKEELSGITVDSSKYEIYSNDIEIDRTPTGRTLTIKIDPTLRKLSGATNTLGSAIRIKKSGNDYYLADNNGNPLPEEFSDRIEYNDNGTVKQIRPGRDTSEIENGTIIEGTDNGVPALCILYKDNDGNYQLSKTSLDDLLSDKYAGLGIEIKSLSDTGYTKIATKLHPNQEYLGVDENGLYVTGITESLNELKQYVDSQIESAMTVIRQEISAHTQNAINEMYQTLVTSSITETVKNYLVGTDYEIDLYQTDDNRLRIGFTNNALFGVEKEFMNPD